MIATLGACGAHAAPLFWDNNGTAPGFGTAGGTWGAEPNWSADAAGLAEPSVTNTAAADDLHFGTASNGLAAGTVTVAGNAQGFRSLTFGAASGPVTLTGGTLHLGAPVATVHANSDSNTIGTALAGTAALTKFGALVHTAFLTTNAATIFPGASLAAYRSVDGVIGGAYVGGGGAAIAAEPYFYTNDGARAACQLQILDGTWTKCVKIELTQAGPDIQGRVLYAKYIDNGRQLGYDFDAGGNVQAVATSFAAGGYGVAETALTLDAHVTAFLPPAPASATVARNASVADVVGATGVAGGGFIANVAAPGQVYFFTHSGTTATYQLQLENGGYTKCVKIELTQAGADIAARVLYAKYTTAGSLGFNFDTGGTANTIATAFTAAGYGAAQTVLDIYEPNTVLTLSGTNTYAGSTTIGGGVLAIGAAGQLGAGLYTGAVCNTSGLLCNSDAPQTLAGRITGPGSLVKGRAGDFSMLTHDGFLTAASATLFRGARLADFVDASAIMGGASIANRTPRPGDAHFFRNDGTVATFQLQLVEAPYTKCVKVELTQVGDDIAGRALYAKYVNAVQPGYDFDAGGTAGAIATSYTTPDYGVAMLKLLTYRSSRLTLSGANAYGGGTAVHRGVLEATTSAAALPSAGGVAVGRHGELRLNVAGMAFNNAGGVGNGNPITVTGGLLTLGAGFNAGHSRPIVIDGGTLNTIVTENGDGANYLNNLTLRNGAQVTGYPVRMGNFSSAAITVSGTAPASLEAGLSLVVAGAQPLTITVADVTGDDAVDFTIAGVMRDYPGLTGMPVVKAGAGTLVLAGANTYAGTTTVADGTLALGAADSLGGVNPIVLGGGTLAPGLFSGALGALSVTADSRLDLGSGQLAFADSSAQPWGGNLTLTGTLQPRALRFGTTAGGLTQAQLQRIVYAGRQVSLDADGYVVTDTGTLVIVR